MVLEGMKLISLTWFKSPKIDSSDSNNTLHANYQVACLYINYTGERAAHTVQPKVPNEANDKKVT